MTGIIGIISILLIALLLSKDIKKINPKIIGWGLCLQFSLGILILRTPIGPTFFSIFDKAINKLISFSYAGSDFLFKSFDQNIGYHLALANFAFRALPTIIFFSSLMAIFYHLGIIQVIIKYISKIMRKTMGTSGSETLSVSANIFVGQTEAPLIIKPFISSMTKSELMAVMTGGFSTIAGGVMALYITILSDVPGIAGHLLAASIMSAPAALVIAKIILPETEISKTLGDINITIPKSSDNVLEALSNGASDGLKLAANVAGMVIAFVSVIALINYLFGFIGLSLEIIFGFIFKPLAWTMGVNWDEAGIMGQLMGEKIIFTELIAYSNLRDLRLEGMISDRTAIIASYALCGFANFSSIGIQMGGIGTIAPSRKKDLSKIVLKAMIGGALASWLTATIAGILIL